MTNMLIINRVHQLQIHCKFYHAEMNYVTQFFKIIVISILGYNFRIRQIFDNSLNIAVGI
jgi:hypothetical protein